MRRHVAEHIFPVDPMTAFYAAVTAVENGSVGEIELEYRCMSSNDEEMTMMMTVRREPRSFTTVTTNENREDE
jgi:hypothetical protein